MIENETNTDISLKYVLVSFSISGLILIFLTKLSGIITMKGKIVISNGNFGIKDWNQNCYIRHQRL